MPRLRSLVIRIEIDEAIRGHNCQGNTGHRIESGARRIKVRKGRSWEHYCIECAQAILQRDIAILQELVRRLEVQ